MRIENFRLEPPGSGRSAVARFDLQLSDHVRLFDWALRRNERGQLRATPPETRNRVRAASVAIELLATITALAGAEYATHTGGPQPHERIRAA